MNRRQFLCTASAASVAWCARVPLAAAATYDLVVKGGRVIDPSLGINTIGDVAIAGGRIAAVGPDIAAEGAQVLDARGKLVVPGLIDVHTHAARDKEAAPVCLADGVTAMVDAGSRGAQTIDESVTVARAAPNQLRVLVNISRIGSQPLMALDLADVGLARGAIARNPDTIVGIKARLERGAWGGAAGDLEALRRAQDAAAPFKLPVMIHLGQPDAPLREILALLKRGDIVTHMYAPAPNGILDDNGRLLPEVLAARRRGVLFDVGNGTVGHITWEQAERAIKQGFVPDTISTDWTPTGRAGGVGDLPNVMSKFLLLGMSLEQVVACVTINAGRMFAAFHDRGTFNVGAPGDVAVLELREGTFEFVDNFDGKRTGRQRLFPNATVLAGKQVPTRA